MTVPIAGSMRNANPPASDRTPRNEQLQKTAKQLEGVFVLQMLKAMRATVPKGGITEQSNGEETFTSMLDQKIADKIPAQWKHGLTDALMKQLEGRDIATRSSSTPTNPTMPVPEQSK